MVSEAQKRANEKYNRNSMVQRVVRFSPRERDLLEHLDSQPNRARYIKALIEADLRDKRDGHIKHFEFEGTNMSTATIDIVADYNDGFKDLLATVEGSSKEFPMMDGGQVSDITN